MLIGSSLSCRMLRRLSISRPFHILDFVRRPIGPLASVSWRPRLVPVGPRLSCGMVNRWACWFHVHRQRGTILGTCIVNICLQDLRRFCFQLRLLTSGSSDLHDPPDDDLDAGVDVLLVGKEAGKEPINVMVSFRDLKTSMTAAVSRL